MKARLRPLHVFALLSFQLYANIEGDEWVYHGLTQDYRFKRAGDVRGSPLVSIKAIAERIGLEFSYDEKQKKGFLKGKKTGRKILFTLGDPNVTGFWGASELSKAPMMFRGEVVVPVDFADKALRPLLTGHPPPKPHSFNNLYQADLVIDPGHGGNDWGAHIKLGKDIVKEKDLTLLIAKDLCLLLKNRKVHCLLTREQDNYLSLHERTQFSNRAQAKFFLSLHLNSDPSKEKMAKGFELYVLSLVKDAETRAAVARENQSIPEDLPEGVEKAVADLKAESLFENSLKWAKSLALPLGAINKSFGKSIKTGPFYVLYGANMPSVLAELGFLTHEEDRIRWRSPTARMQNLLPLADLLAQEIKKGIVRP